MTVYAIDKYRNNAELIVACADLGYLHDEWLTLDATYGEGTFWGIWQPYKLITHDLAIDGVDFRDLPYDNDYFDAVVLDGPYKLNGTPTPTVDRRYGVDHSTRWQDRIELINEGIDECTRVLKHNGFLLIKCQDQVSSGQVRWQTRIFADRAERNGCRLDDMLHFVGGRAQPDGRRQVHARRNYSTMLVCRKERR